MDYEGFLELVRQRRSVRSFKADPIPDEQVDKVVEAARFAPSGFNLQPWEFVIVKDGELRNRIVQYIRDVVTITLRMEAARESWQGAQLPTSPPPMGFAAAPVFIIPFGDVRTRDGLPMFHRYSEESWNRTFTSSLASAFIYMHLAATSLGLGSQWVSAVTQPAAACLIKQLLGIPAPLQIYDMMALGYPNMTPPPRLVRSREEMVHRDACGVDDFKNDAQVKDFIFKIRNPQAPR
jgi:nitroreductase